MFMRAMIAPVPRRKHLVAHRASSRDNRLVHCALLDQAAILLPVRNREGVHMNKFLIATAVAVSVAFAGSALAQTPAPASTPAVTGAPAAIAPAAKSKAKAHKTKAKAKQVSQLNKGTHASVKTKVAPKA
jgi:hypothetical protein